AAGACPPPSRTRTGPASPRRSVCAPAVMALPLYRRPHRRTEFIPFCKETPTMWFISLFRRPKQSRKRARVGRVASPAYRRRSFVPRLESLEDRTVPSTLTVTNNLDKGAGSLRDTIKAASSGDTIVFASSLTRQTITLTSGELAFSKSVDIEGPGAGLLAVSGNNATRIFNLSQNQKAVAVTIAGLTLTQARISGGTDGGGAILNVGT